MSIKTVNVPKSFEPLFRKAQDYVRRYFRALKANPEHGTIEIFGQRYIFVRAASMSVEFFDLVKRAYEDRDEQESIAIARNLLFDIAHAIGAADAREFHKKMRVKDPIAKLSAGPIHFAYSGWAFVDIHPDSRPTPDENYFLIYDHPYSFESDSWKRAKRKVDFPVCVMNAGYSSGWCQESFGIDLVATEITCKAKGDEHCRFIMAHPSQIEKHVRAYSKGHRLSRPDTYEIPGFFSRKTAEAELRKTLEEIDQRIAARTEPLEEANAQLRREIEDRIRSEAALAQSEEKYRKLIETAKDAIFVADVETGIIQTVNQKAQELIGLPAEKIVGMHQSQLHPPDQARYYEYVFRSFLQGVAVPTEDLFAQHVSGRKIPIEISASLCEIDGRMCVQGVFRDISAQRQTIDALTASEDRYKAFVKNSAEGIYRLEIDPPIPTSLSLDEQVQRLLNSAIIAECNEAQARMYGFDHESKLVGRPIRELLIPTDPENVAYLKRFLKNYRIKDEASHEIDAEGRDKYFQNNAIGIVENGLLVRVWGTQRDITDRMAADRALKQSEERYRTLVESMQEMVLITDYDHKILYANRGAEAVTGFDASELQLRAPEFPHVHPEDRPIILEAIESFIRSDARHSPMIENRYIRDTGEIRWHATILSKAQYEGKPVLQYLVRDVTDQKQRQIELEIGRANLRAIVDNTMDSIWSIDPDFRIVTVNATFQVAFEMTFNHRLEPGSDILSVLPGPLRTTWEGRYRRALNGEAFSIQDEITVGNQFRFFDIAFNPIRTAAGEVVGAAMFSRDITEQREAVLALQNSEERLSVTLRSIGDGVITTDAKGRILFVNREAERLTGWSQAECIGLPIVNVLNLVHERSRQPIEDPVRRIISSGAIIEVADQTILINRNGSEILIADSGAPIRDREGHIIGVVLVFRDVTEKRMAEEERVKAMKLESVGILAGGIAHDFNNLLTAILGNLSLAKIELTEGHTDQVRNILARSETASLRAKDLTQQLLTFSRGGAPVRRRGSIVNLIRESAEFMSHGSSVRPRYEIADDLWSVDADHGQITQVVHNLVINAIQAMPHGGEVHVRARNQRLAAQEKQALKEGNYIVVEVSDQGEGIPKSILPKIFDPYFTTKEKGSGLGLATCYSIIKRHDGLIEVRSEPGQGSTFTVYIPAIVEVEVETPEAVVVDGVGRGRVLVMDDEADIRDITMRILGRLGYEAVVTSNGKEAVEAYSQAISEGRHFDAVIMDLTVPGGMGGREAAEAILKADPTAKIVVASGYSNDPVMADHRAYGFKGVISKPFRIEDLQRVLVGISQSK